MRSSARTAPLFDDHPCGPDLNASFDPAYEEYYFGALGRLPGFYMQPGIERPDNKGRTPDRLFDPKDVDHRAERREIDALLARSRDLRLLVLQAQWDALAGQRAALRATIDDMAELLEQHPDEVHPTLAEGVSDRREAINDLNQTVTMVQPLMFMGLSGTTEVTLRKLRVARGDSAPLQHEAELELKPLLDALSTPANGKKVEEALADFAAMSAAVQRIQTACSSHADKPFQPALDQVQSVLDDIVDTLTTARPDLAAEVAPEPPQPQDPAPKPDLQAPPSLAAPQAPAAATTARGAAHAITILSQLHARRVLEACEHYYRKEEPSSAALLLVTQARLLIGKPLIEALRALLPSQAESAVVDFGAPTGFLLGAERLAELSNALPEDSGAPPALPQDPGPDPKITTAPQAAQALQAVEAYFRQTERSSPVPVLLQRAQSYLDKDFQSLIEELIPQQNTA
ncbi:ImpA family type VI secretion system protein [Epibacterium sp. Ofav1-8]|uniref:type VI secretion system protein TssA n=1 Tax=Epibacterium sp. Ofav1-8 TaxID=2917735 RepID=UPI001EF4F351|nr:type VI secretion system ImpA family N-terminal domain-containing protein [Epibacterium sp. Ofav1-8]MCG7625026.1 type VI secretion system ImpA family N-terminal domain-containing protein [Epibacterium sp. Ofav1-8]